MNTKPPLLLWPFLAADAVLLLLAAAVMRYGHRPLTAIEAALMVLCGLLGGLISVAPFWRRNQDAESFAHRSALGDATEPLRDLKQLAAQIGSATKQWNEWQIHSGQTVATAQRAVEQMSKETSAFSQLLQRGADAERANLRLEVEKLRRGEGERLQVITHLLDHVFALTLAARQSGQPTLIEQIGQFQNACLDAARRIGLSQAPVKNGDVFDPKMHRLTTPDSESASGVISDVFAPGYTYQGRLLRPTTVALAMNPTE